MPDGFDRSFVTSAPSTTPPPHLAFVVPGLAMGGAEAQLASLLEADRGVLGDARVTIVSVSSERHPSVEQRMERAGATLLTIDRTATSFPTFLLRLTGTLRDARPDLVHCFLAGTSGTWGRVAALAAGVRTIALSDLSANPTTTRVQRALNGWLHGATTRFLPNAWAIAERLEREGAPPDRIVLVRNGVDLSRFAPSAVDVGAVARMRRAHGVLDDDVVVGYLGMLRPAKRPLDLLEAVLTLPEDERPAAVWFTGDGSERPVLERRIAADAWATRHVRLVGVLDDPLTFLAAIDVLALVSETEGFPNAVMEAMAMAKPVVATAVADVPELVTGCGTVVPPGDLGALAGALAEVVALPHEARRALGAAGRLRAEQAYGMDAAARAFWGEHAAMVGLATTVEHVVVAGQGVQP